MMNPTELLRRPEPTYPDVPKAYRGGCIYIETRTMSSPEVYGLSALAIVGWVYSLTWTSQMRRETNWVLPLDVAESFMSAEDRRSLVECGWWGEVDGGYLPHRINRRGIPLWKPGASPDERVKIPDATRALVYARDGFQCVLCRSTEDLSLDHIYPWSLGGSDREDNLQTLCRPCNSSKGAKV